MLHSHHCRFGWNDSSEHMEPAETFAVRADLARMTPWSLAGFAFRRCSEPFIRLRIQL